MTDIIFKVINLFFGNTTKQRFIRLIIILTIGMLYVNISFGFKDGKFYFTWDNVDVNLNINKGE